jgi:hypothetical protein
VERKENHPLNLFQSETSAQKNVPEWNIKQRVLREMRGQTIFSARGFFTFLQGKHALDPVPSPLWREG